MKLSDYAQVAEIASGIGVVVTLIFLVVEIRNNTEATKAATYDSISADLAEFQLRLADNDPSIEITTALASNNGSLDSLSSEQLERYTFIMSALFKHYERAFIQWQYGNLDDEAWERLEAQICMPRPELFEEYIWQRIRNNSTQSFIEYRESCGE